MSISATLQALTGSFQDNGFGPSLEALTGEFAGTEGGVGEILAQLEALSGDFSGPANFDGSIDGSLEPLRGTFLGEYVTSLVLEPLEGSFSGLVGTAGGIVASLQALDGAFAGNLPTTGAISASFQALTASFSGYPVAVGPVVGSLRAPRGSFEGLVGSVGSLAASFEEPTGSFSGHTVASGLVVAQLPRLRGAFGGGPAVAQTFRTWAANTRHAAVTEYTSFPFNSFARYNGVVLAAGPDGLYRLGGEDDEGTAISWYVVTGQSDDKKSALKRLTEVLMGLRFDGAVKVRVWKDDDTMYEYTLPNFREGVLHQARVKTGRGLRSRYFKVGVSGTGPTLELDSLQLIMPDTKRRVG